jgi:flavodoxin
MKTLTAYFSAEGRTAKAAALVAKETESELFEIKPVEPYSESDINWKNPLARCNREKIGKKDVAIESAVVDFAAYDVIFLGFPIWYYGAPNIVQTFCKTYDWSGKKLCIFATSGGSEIGRTAEKLSPYIEGAEIIGAKVLKNTESVIRLT